MLHCLLICWYLLFQCSLTLKSESTASKACPNRQQSMLTLLVQIQNIALHCCDSLRKHPSDSSGAPFYDVLPSHHAGILVYPRWWCTTACLLCECLIRFFFFSQVPSLHSKVISPIRYRFWRIHRKANTLTSQCSCAHCIYHKQLWLAGEAGSDSVFNTV